MFCCNATKILPVFTSWAFVGSLLWTVIDRISTEFCFGPFFIIEITGGDNSSSLCTCVLYFLCCLFLCYIFRVVLKSLHSLQQLLMISVWKSFGQTLEKIVFSELSNLVLIHYLVIFMCLFQKYLSVSKLNFLLLFLLILFFSDISVVLGWFRNLPLLLSSLH